MALTCVGALSINTGLAWRTWRIQTQTFIDINAVAKCILYEASAALELGSAAEGARCILAVEGGETVVSSCCTFINIFTAIVLSKFVACATIDLSLAAERSHLINTDLSNFTVVGPRDTFINIFTCDTVWLELVTIVT